MRDITEAQARIEAQQNPWVFEATFPGCYPEEFIRFESKEDARDYVKSFYGDYYELTEEQLEEMEGAGIHPDNTTFIIRIYKD